jgi:3-dehydroquinate synthetase
MVVAARLAQEAGLFSTEDAERQNRLLVALGLPTEYHGAISGQDILSRTQLDKKVVGKRVRWVMPEKIGQVIVTTLPDDLVQRVVSAYFADAPGEKA